MYRLNTLMLVYDCSYYIPDVINNYYRHRTYEYNTVLFKLQYFQLMIFICSRYIIYNHTDARTFSVNISNLKN